MLFSTKKKKKNPLSFSPQSSLPLSHLSLLFKASHRSRVGDRRGHGMTISMVRSVWRDWRPSPTTTPCRRTSFFFLLILSSSTMLVWPFSPSWTTCMSTHPPFLLLSILVAKDKENHVLSFRFSLQYLYKRTDHVSLKAKKKKLIELMGLFYFLGWSNTITHPYEFLSNQVEY